MTSSKGLLEEGVVWLQGLHGGRGMVFFKSHHDFTWLVNFEPTIKVPLKVAWAWNIHGFAYCQLLGLCVPVVTSKSWFEWFCGEN